MPVSLKQKTTNSIYSTEQLLSEMDTPAPPNNEEYTQIKKRVFYQMLENQIGILENQQEIIHLLEKGKKKNG